MESHWKPKTMITKNLQTMEITQHTSKQSVKEEVSKFFKIHKLNGNKMKGNQNMWEATKAVPTGKFIARNATLDKREHRKVPTTKTVKRAT